MKAIYYLISICSAMLIITACTQPQFHYRDACWEGTCVGGQCGSCIKHHCEKSCENCRGYGQNCTKCWACIKRDACMQESL